ncbi:cold shock and DUF1294 domain-containing protein [Cupriavidus oxalaticus]|uniref:cold shock and DUF1294 domain-containing protein n=1 Tax=Cupriavidus oxalaticus TaxID=96344 RepID=UPI001F0F9C87|nr:cold shock and DUF1294 domain-containing protein [Cupriavidus oxalaticus]
MRKTGRVKTWHADKGFGFIDVHADTKDVFFHITALQTRAVTPTPGDRVSFELGKGRDGRMQALNVAIVGAPKARSDARPWPLFAGLAALGLIAGGALAGYFPRQAGLVSLLASLITFFAYADDKTRASRNTWRTPETTLHLLALCGGWPGGACRPAAAATQEPEADVSGDVLGHGRRERWRDGALAIRHGGLRKGWPTTAATQK